MGRCQVCSNFADAAISAKRFSFCPCKVNGEILHWFIMVKRIFDFFSECASPIDFKFGLEFPCDKVLKVCSGEVDPDLHPDIMDHLIL